MLNIAYFISPHGFGHAARACAVVQSLSQLVPDIHFDLFTSIPGWFFSESLTCSFTINEALVDVGLVQSNPLEEDLDATLQALSKLYPVPGPHIDRLVEKLLQNNCRLVINDISPIGLQAAHQAGIRSVLIENFTWDWIYENYLSEKIGFGKYISILHDLFALRNVHIQTEPLCDKDPNADLVVPPISREPRTSALIIREKLGIQPGQKMVLLTMGGIETNKVHLPDSIDSTPVVWVIPGGSRTPIRKGNLVLLPHHSSFYHPDLINACDAVISKAGYSTIAEAYYAGIPFGYIQREHFRESPILENFIAKRMPSLHLSSEDLVSPRISQVVNHLLNLKTAKPAHPNGSIDASLWITKFLKAL